MQEEVPRVGERRQRGTRGRRSVGQTRVEALGALVHDRPRLGFEIRANCHNNKLFCGVDFYCIVTVAVAIT